jgi:hypothetical protein
MPAITEYELRIIHFEMKKITDYIVRSTSATGRHKSKETFPIQIWHDMSDLFGTSIKKYKSKNIIFEIKKAYVRSKLRLGLMLKIFNCESYACWLFIRLYHNQNISQSTKDKLYPCSWTFDDHAVLYVHEDDLIIDSWVKHLGIMGAGFSKVGYLGNFNEYVEPLLQTSRFKRNDFNIWFEYEWLKECEYIDFSDAYKCNNATCLEECDLELQNFVQNMSIN